MKTVELLAKYLHEWPDEFIRIIQSSSGAFVGVTHSELSCSEISNPALAGLPVAEDEGEAVTFQDWSNERLSQTQKANDSHASMAKEKTDDDYRREHLYSMKLQCLHAAITQSGLITEESASSLAKAINAGFDAIT